MSLVTCNNFPNFHNLWRKVFFLSFQFSLFYKTPKGIICTEGRNSTVFLVLYWLWLKQTIIYNSSHHECPDNIPDGLILLDEPVEIIHQDTVLVRHLLGGQLWNKRVGYLLTKKGLCYCFWLESLPLDRKSFNPLW